MHDISNTIKHIIDVFGAEKLRDKQFFINAIEDYSPELEEDRLFLEKIYSDKVGGIIAGLIGANTKRISQGRKELEQYLVWECGYNDKWVSRFFDMFYFVFGKGITQLQVSASSAVPQTIRTQEFDYSSNPVEEKPAIQSSVDSHQAVNVSKEFVSSSSIAEIRDRVNRVMEKLYGHGDFLNLVNKKTNNISCVFFQNPNWYSQIYLGRSDAYEGKKEYESLVNAIKGKINQKGIITEEMVGELKTASDNGNVAADFELGKYYRYWYEWKCHYNSTNIYGTYDLCEEQKNAWFYMERAAQHYYNAYFLLGVWHYIDWIKFRVYQKGWLCKPLWHNEAVSSKENAEKFLRKSAEVDTEYREDALCLLDHMEKKWRTA